MVLESVSILVEEKREYGIPPPKANYGKWLAFCGRAFCRGGIAVRRTDALPGRPVGIPRRSVEKDTVMDTSKGGRIK